MGRCIKQHAYLPNYCLTKIKHVSVDIQMNYINNERGIVYVNTNKELWVGKTCTR